MNITIVTVVSSIFGLILIISGIYFLYKQQPSEGDNEIQIAGLSLKSRSSGIILAALGVAIVVFVFPKIIDPDNADPDYIETTFKEAKEEGWIHDDIDTNKFVKIDTVKKVDKHMQVDTLVKVDTLIKVKSLLELAESSFQEGSYDIAY